MRLEQRTLIFSLATEGRIQDTAAEWSQYEKENYKQTPGRGDGGREGRRGAYRRGVVCVLAGQHVGQNVADGGREDGHQDQGAWEEGGRERQRRICQCLYIKIKLVIAPLPPSLPPSPFLTYSPPKDEQSVVSHRQHGSDEKRFISQLRDQNH